MCEAITGMTFAKFMATYGSAIAAGTAMATTGLSIYSQREQMKYQNEVNRMQVLAQNKYMEQMYQAQLAADAASQKAIGQAVALNEGAAVDTLQANFAALNDESLQEAENRTQELDDLRRERAVRIAQAEAQAAGAGVGGNSVNALLLDLSGKGLEAGTTAEKNYARGQAARESQGKAMANNAAWNRAIGRHEARMTAMNSRQARPYMPAIYVPQRMQTADYLAAGLRIVNTGVNYYANKS